MNRRKLESDLKKIKEFNLSNVLEAVDRNTKRKKPRKQSAYNAFVSDNFKNVKDVPNKEKMKVIANMWNSMSKDKKDAYKRLHAEYNL